LQLFIFCVIFWARRWLWLIQFIRLSGLIRFKLIREPILRPRFTAPREA
jgi:hypothetical protein